MFRHFDSIKDGTSNVCKQASSIVSKHASSGALGVSEKEAIKVTQKLKSISTQNSELGKRSRTQYAEKVKMRIFHYTSWHGYRQFVRRFANEFPQLNESSIRHWTSTYKSQLVQQQAEETIVIGLKRGRPAQCRAEGHGTKHENIGCTNQYSYYAWHGGEFGSL